MLVALSVKAQESKVNYGVKAGLNQTWLGSGSFDAYGTHILGYHLGGFAEIKLDKSVSFQSELLYSTYGADFVGFDLKTDYISVPLIFKFYVSKSFAFDAGAQIAFLSQSNLEYKPLNVRASVNDKFNTTDVSVQLVFFCLLYKKYFLFNQSGCRA